MPKEQKSESGSAVPSEFGDVKDFDLVLLANFVHQVVNPLNGVAGTLDNLADGTIKQENRRSQRLRAARAQVEQCISLMRNLAYLAQGFTKIPDKDQKEAVLPEIIIESAMFFQEDGKAKGIEISLSDPKTQNVITGHVELIRQVIMNVLDNCVKYSEKNSTVLIEQWIQKNTSHAIIQVTNKSKFPISREDIDKIFSLGYRGQNAKSIVASGTGLGLYICKRIVEDVHGGSIHVQTSGAQDVVFTIKIPNGKAGRKLKE